jgi:Zn finger protein HypA/HybF involved in hydrogenase expression
MRAAVQQVLAAARLDPGWRVRQVRLMVGVSDHTSEELVRTLFEALAAGTVAESARIVVSWAPARMRCFGCGLAFEQAQPGPAPPCPRCAGPALREPHADLLVVTDLEVASEERRPCA